MIGLILLFFREEHGPPLHDCLWSEHRRSMMDSLSDLSTVIIFTFLQDVPWWLDKLGVEIWTGLTFHSMDFVASDRMGWRCCELGGWCSHSLSHLGWQMQLPTWVSGAGLLFKDLADILRMLVGPQMAQVRLWFCLLGPLVLGWPWLFFHFINVDRHLLIGWEPILRCVWVERYAVRRTTLWLLCLPLLTDHWLLNKLGNGLATRYMMLNWGVRSWAHIYAALFSLNSLLLSRGLRPCHRWLSRWAGIVAIQIYSYGWCCFLWLYFLASQLIIWML